MSLIVIGGIIFVAAIAAAWYYVHTHPIVETEVEADLDAALADIKGIIAHFEGHAVAAKNVAATSPSASVAATAAVTASTATAAAAALKTVVSNAKA